MRSRLVTVVLAMLPGLVFAADGINMPGKDYANFNAPTWSSCRDTCAGESECQAYTWVKPGIQGPSGRCWLKSAVPPIVRDACCVSSSRQRISERDVKAEGKINRPGMDFKNFTTNSWKTCEATCTENDVCRAWTYVHPGVQGPTGRCWLKNRVARPVADANTDSGVKYKPASVPFD
jgi:hypothetical protein